MYTVYSHFRCVKLQFCLMAKVRIHIGKKIKDFLDKSPITVVEFAEKINLTRGGANKIFTKASISTEQLEKISKVLGHNFFNDYNSAIILEAKENKTDYGYATKEDLAEIVQLFTKEMSKLREEVLKKKIKKPIKKYGKRK